MKILILGGSNSGPGGWVRMLTDLAPEHDIENKFLGAVGSLFGILRLLKMHREGETKPDVIVFEYTLNDSIWLWGRNISIQLIKDTLHDVITYCARNGIRLIFLCLCVRPFEGAGESEASLFMDRLYQRIARARGVADCIMLADILGKISFNNFADPYHLAAGPSLQVAKAVAARLREPIPIPRGSRRRTSFLYLDASAARTESPSQTLYRRSSVFDGPFIELSRGGASHWPAEGRLVALMVRSTEWSGYYRIRLKDQSIRKNAQSLARKDVPKLMIMHYVACQPLGGPQIVIDMPAIEDELMKLENDLTLMEGLPSEPFPSQKLEINGIIVYRNQSLIDRLADKFSQFNFWVTGIPGIPGT